MDASIIQSGSFISTGQSKTLQIRSGFDWIQTYNLTKITAPANVTLQAYWQFGMPSGQGIKYNGSAGANTLQLTALAVGTGFTPVDSSGNPLSSAVATTAISSAPQPVVLTANTSGIATGTNAIIRIYGNANALEFNGLDLYVSTVGDTSFTSIPVFGAGADQGGAQAGFYRVVNFDPLYYPRSRRIVKIAANVDNTNYTDITLSVPSGYIVGQAVRLSVPPAFGSIQLDGQLVTITNVNDTIAAIGNYPAVSITVNVPMTGVTAFTFPTAALYKTSPALTVPVGENTSYAIQQAKDILSDATYNSGYIGVVLSAGANSPAGANADVIYWVAGKSSYTQ